MTIFVICVGSSLLSKATDVTERSRRYSRMDTDYHQESQYSDYDDTGLYTDDYDDEVLATLNS